MTIGQYMDTVFSQIHKDTRQVDFVIGLDEQTNVNMDSQNTIMFTVFIRKKDREVSNKDLEKMLGVDHD